MPAIHLLYDPTDKVSLPAAETVKAMGVSVVLISLPEGLDLQRIEETSRRLAKLLLTEVYKTTAAEIGEG